MKFYHRTTKERWESIQKEGVLWGLPWSGLKSWEEAEAKKENWNGYPRYTYLSPDDWGESYGPVLLEVEYEPKREDQGIKHNFAFDCPPGEYCWQFSVFEPIDISNVKNVLLRA